MYRPRPIAQLSPIWRALSDNRLALVCHAQEVTAIGGGRYSHGARNAQFDVLPAIGGGDDVKQYGYVDGTLGQFAPQYVGQVCRNVLVRRWGVLVILYAQQQTTARCIGKSNAILCDLVPVGRLAGYRLQGLLVEELTL